MDIIEEIKRLKFLLDEGAISLDEFNELKKKVIEGSQSSIVNGSQTGNKQNAVRKKGNSLLRNSILFCLLIVVPIAVIFGIKNIDFIKKKLPVVSATHDNEGREYAYEDGKKIGVIVKMEVKTTLANTGGGVDQINVPPGKMWTPLYYELVQGSERYPTIYFFPLRTAYGYLKSEAYLFDVSKERFVSYRYSKQNYSAFAGKGEAAVAIPSYNPNSTYLIYFLEE